MEDLPAGKRRADLELWLATDLPAWFAANLLPVTGSIAYRCGRLIIRAKRNGTPPATADGLIAATTLEYDLILVIRNVRDLMGLGLTLLNPWDIA